MDPHFSRHPLTPSTQKAFFSFLFPGFQDDLSYFKHHALPSVMSTLVFCTRIIEQVSSHCRRLKHATNFTENRMTGFPGGFEGSDYNMQQASRIMEARFLLKIENRRYNFQSRSPRKKLISDFDPLTFYLLGL